MTGLLSWEEVDAALDEVEADDIAGVVDVFERFEGRATDEFDGRGARQTVNISSFSLRYGVSRATFSRWLQKYGKTRKEAS